MIAYASFADIVAEVLRASRAVVGDLSIVGVIAILAGLGIAAGLAISTAAGFGTIGMRIISVILAVVMLAIFALLAAAFVIQLVTGGMTKPPTTDELVFFAVFVIGYPVIVVKFFAVRIFRRRDAEYGR